MVKRYAPTTTPDKIAVDLERAAWFVISLIYKEESWRLSLSSREQFLGKMLTDVGAAMSGALVLIGDKLGLYKALAEHGPLDSAELAKRTGTTERYIREWLAAQAAAGYVNFDAATKKYSMDARADRRAGR